MKNIKYLMFLLVLLAITSGCKKFLVEQPKSIASPQTVLSSAPGFDAVLVGEYSNITGWGKMYSWDVLKLNESFVDFQVAPQAPDFSNGSIISSDYPVESAWSNLYAIINSSNQILANISNIASDPNRQRIEGEAKFLRAWAYFDLVQFFGDVPLVTTSVSDPSNFQPSRAKQAAVYQQIISDLTDAETMMGDASVQPSRANKWIAKAYLTEVYLTMAGSPNNITTFNGKKIYQLAEDEAQQIISSNRYSINVPYQTVFLTTGDAETIWEIRSPNIANYNHFTFLTQAIMTPSQGFINSFDPKDVRGPAWGIRSSYTLNGTVYTFPYPTYMKFVDTVQYAAGQQFQSTLSITLMRLANIYLMAAEADNQVNGGPSTNAYNWINAIRRRAGIANLTPGLSQTDFNEAIFNERRHELYGEGFDWFDLKRFNKFALLDTTKRKFVTTIDAHLNYFPISNVEITNNPHVTQNPGWPGP